MSISVMTAFDALAQQMRSAGYMESTITQYRRQFGQLSRLCEDGVFSSSAALRYASCTHPDGTPHGEDNISFKKRIVSLIEGYLSTGEFDLSPKARPGKERPVGALGDELSRFEADVLERDLAAGTKANYVDYARTFLLFLESTGKTATRDAAPSDVWAFMSHIGKVRPNTGSASIASHLNPLLRFLERDDLVRALKMAVVPAKRKIIGVLSEEDEDAVAEACCSGKVSSKDAAITLLALTTGLRACDIINLRLCDISWDEMAVGIVQSKTGNPLSLPLQPAVAEALASYILEERPEPLAEGDDHVFLKSRAPHTPFVASASVHQAISRCMRAAGLGMCGSRKLRHNAATKLLRAGVEHATISAVLGHASPSSTDRYLELDSGPMRACVLPMPREVRA